MNSQLILNPGRDKSLLRRHPWVFSGAVGQVKGDPQPGDTVDVVSADGQFMGRGAYSPISQIRARIWTWQQGEEVDADFFRRRLQRCLNSRQQLDIHSDAYRLVHAESDGLPGLVVDRYGDLLVMQALSWGAEAWREQLADLLMQLLQPEAIYERSDAEVRKLEGLEPREGLLRGQLAPGARRIREHALQFLVEVEGGHKTGFYLDQRDNRFLVRQLAEGKEMLDCFSYTGGFAANALKGGASRVTLVEESNDAITLAGENIEINELPRSQCEFVQGDAFQVLRRFRDAARQFDLVILDPPKFAPTRAQAEKAARGYKDINLLALKLLRPGGHLVTFSCSGGVDADLFQKVVAGAALDAGVDARILQRLSQGPDHPVALNFAEGEYLKGLVIEVG